MTTTAYKVLNGFIDQYPNNATLQQIKQQIDSEAVGTPPDNEAIIALYNRAIPHIEEEIWRDELDDATVTQYQQLFQELEQLMAAQGVDTRHKFVITIPVADRPKHLQSCLASLLTLCQKFSYGGNENGKYRKVMAMIADDSRKKESISTNREIAQQFTRAGLETLYFGQDEQLQQIDLLNGNEQKNLNRVLGDIDRSRFYHKGASIMRNIAYLKLNTLQHSTAEPLLFYFIDSDQEFRVKVHSSSGNRDIYAISYLHKLDQIFTQNNISILTGKVVGDPPVSPSVMAGNFLQDVLAFLEQMASLDPQSTCQLHGHEKDRIDDASYHDMADLFGFKPALDASHYNCTLTGDHNHTDCFNDFADKLNRFFDGEHPTRQTYYENQEFNSSITPARTIYSGNYILRPTALDYFIPFATLKLRMAGPALGRIIKAELGGRFVSANLPMLHRRTVHKTGRSEFRAGVDHSAELIDLSGEFERQFFGDLTLFSVEQLTTEGYPQRRLPEEHIHKSVHSMEASLHHKYQLKQQQIIKNISLLKERLAIPEQWWNHTDRLAPALAHFQQFINNIDHNFGAGARAYELIGSASNREQRLKQIVAAITHYSDDRASWKAVVPH